MNRRRTRWSCSALMAALAIPASVSLTLAEGAESKDDKIARAMRAAPSSISQSATIMDVDGTVLRPGTNGWTCMPGLSATDRSPMCNDAVWEKLMQAVGAKADFRTERAGISYMLEGDAAPVSNTDPFDAKQDPGEVWVQEGPHLMVVLPDPKMLEGISEDPNNGGPYVMWKGTPYAHVMVPVAPRPQQKK
jgi:hypothetical protein